MVKAKRKIHFAGEKKMIRKVWTCPECRFRKFETLNAVNVHMGKSHIVDYKISIVNNKVVFKKKTRTSVRYVKTT
jgi:hypothetical protein